MIFCMKIPSLIYLIMIKLEIIGVDLLRKKENLVNKILPLNKEMMMESIELELKLLEKNNLDSNKSKDLEKLI